MKHDGRARGGRRGTGHGSSAAAKTARATAGRATAAPATAARKSATPAKGTRTKAARTKAAAAKRPVVNAKRPVVNAKRPADAARVETGLLDRGVSWRGGATMPYQVYVPRDYAARRDWPVLLFLHGAGERGGDGLLQTEVGLGTALRRFAARFPCLIVMPQAPLQTRWAGAAADAALAALDATLAEFACDPGRVYLSGLSMGGEGAWYLAWQHPGRFAALLAVCGFVHAPGLVPSFLPPALDADDAGSPYDRLAQRMRGLPTWIVHGEADTAVPVTESRRMYEALEAVGSPVTYTELPGVGHNAWDAAYQSEAIVGWLFAQRHPHAPLDAPPAAPTPTRKKRRTRG